MIFVKILLIGLISAFFRMTLAAWFNTEFDDSWYAFWDRIIYSIAFAICLDVWRNYEDEGYEWRKIDAQ